MPYTGKPSHACETCRKRHIKCDEAEPACTPCVRSNRICPGYRDRLDTVLRSQNEVSRQAVQRRVSRRQASRTPSTSRPPSPPLGYSLIPQSLDAQAVSLFFANYILVSSSDDELARRGFLDYLPQLYGDSRPDSPLFLATAAVSTLLYGVWNPEIQNVEIQPTAQTFGRALKATQDAIQDSVESIRDSTLMTVLMLGFYESLATTYRSEQQSKRHIDGAVALVKHRGARNFESDIAKRLLLVVRCQIIHNMITDAAQYEGPQIPVSESDMDPSIWTDPPGSNMPMDPVTRLDQLSLSALFLPRIDADPHLATWPSTLPDSWHPVSIPCAYEIPSYNGNSDIYPDLSVMYIYNWFRCVRIRFGSDEVIQDMVDGICHSVPFALGDRQDFGPIDREGVNYPSAILYEVSEKHYRAASALGGWYLLGPLTMLVDLQFRLRDGQQDWIVEQFNRLARVYDIRMNE